jgi:small subunit ribosomal protein S1
METEVIETTDEVEEAEEESSEMDTNEATEDNHELKRKTHLKAKVAKITLGGAIIDLGLEKPGFVHLARIQEGSLNRVEDVLSVGQEVDVWVLRADPSREHIELTMIEPLKFDWRELRKGLVVTGTVSRIEKFGAFIEIGAERPGMVHVSEMANKFVRNPHEVLTIGSEVTAKILAVNKQKKQIKLSMKALIEKAEPTEMIPTVQDALKEVDDDDAPVPTAMEMALREAMQRTRGDESPRSKKGKKSRSRDLEDIFSRTLQGYGEK